MIALDLAYRFGISLMIGLLIGLQREFAFQSEDKQFKLFAGLRTYALLGLAGCMAAFIGETLDTPFVLPTVLILIGSMIAISYFMDAREGEAGITSEVAALLTVLLGVLTYHGHFGIAIAVAVAMTVILALKDPSEAFIKKLSREDMYATLKFAAITALILPVLPREGYGDPPFDVLVPYKIWLMVVFISGISFVGYILIRIMGTRRGIGLTGILGGLVSSTAVTLTFTQRSREDDSMAYSFGLAILLAWSIMFIRIIVEVAALNRALLAYMWLPMTAATLAVLAYCVFLYFRKPASANKPQNDFSNPFELKSALIFGLFYAIIILVANTAQLYFGDTGIYLSSIISGLADVDAITLSMAELSQEGASIELSTAARAIVIAAVSNTLLKGGFVLVAGSPPLRRVILPGLLLAISITLGVVFLT